MTQEQLTRRRILTLGGATATAALAGCASAIGSEEEPGPFEDVDASFEAYIVTYHWGYAVFDETGREIDIFEALPGSDTTVYLVNDHAYDAFEKLPDPVQAELEAFDAFERTEQKVEAGAIAPPEHGSIEEKYEMAHGEGHDHDDEDDHGHDDEDDDHGHDDEDDHGHDDEDDGHDHAGGKLDHGFAIPELDVVVDVPADAEEPIEVSIPTDEPGTYDAVCTVDCGYGHEYQREQLLRVTPNA